MSLPYQYVEVKTSELLLDIENPRFASSTLVDNATTAPTEADVIRHLLRFGDIIDLAEEIEKTKYLHGSEMVTCYLNTEGRLIVAEGNRRVCACKLLLNRDLIPADKKDEFPVASQETIDNIKMVMITLYPSRESVQSYLSDRHITGVKKWSALEKNNYYMNLFQQYKDVNIVKSYTSDPVSVVKRSIIKYQFFMRIYKILKAHGHKLAIEEIDYLPLVDRFMGILVGNDPEVGLGLKLDEERLVYLCPDSKKELYENILYLVGKAFLIRTAADDPCRIVGTEIRNKKLQKALIIEDKRIPTLYNLIKEYKKIIIENDTYSGYDDASSDTTGVLTQGKSFEESKKNFVPIMPQRFIPSKYKTERLSFTQGEAHDFCFSGEDYDIKLQEIIRELATIKVIDDPVACACLYRCLLEMCARRVFAKHINPAARIYNEGNLSENLIYINNNVIFNGLSGAIWDKKKKAIKDKFGKDGLVDILNMYIHYPQMVDITYLLESWTTMKIFVIRCLNI